MTRTSLTILTLATLLVALPTAAASIDVHAFQSSGQHGTCGEGEFAYASNDARASVRVRDQEAGAQLSSECFRSTHWGTSDDARVEAFAYARSGDLVDYYEFGLRWLETKNENPEGGWHECHTRLSAGEDVHDLGCPVGAPPHVPALLA